MDWQAEYQQAIAERNALIQRIDAAELELSQERFMRQAAEKECERLRKALDDCQRERTRNADAAARAIDELADNRG